MLVKPCMVDSLNPVPEHFNLTTITAQLRDMDQKFYTGPITEELLEQEAVQLSILSALTVYPQIRGSIVLDTLSQEGAKERFRELFVADSPKTKEQVIDYFKRKLPEEEFANYKKALTDLLKEKGDEYLQALTNLRESDPSSFTIFRLYLRYLSLIVPSR